MRHGPPDHGGLRLHAGLPDREDYAGRPDVLSYRWNLRCSPDQDRRDASRRCADRVHRGVSSWPARRRSVLPVSMYNRTGESSARAMAGVERGLKLFVDAGLSTPAEAEAARARVRPTNDLRDAVRG